MSEFEFVQVTFAIILGLGVTEILRGVGEQVRARHYLRLYPLQLVASCIIPNGDFDRAMGMMVRERCAVDVSAVPAAGGTDHRFGAGGACDSGRLFNWRRFAS